MRIKSTIISSIYAIASYLLLAILAVAVRKIFLMTLPVEMLGYEGLFGNVFAILAMADLGLETLILYRMFASFAKEDKEEISKLMSVYKLLYKFIGFGVLVLGILLIPFLRIIIRDNTTPWKYIIVIYFIQLGSTLCTYFLAYKRLMYAVSLRVYECTKVDTVVSFAFNLLKIAILLILKNYYIYLVCNLAANLLSNLIISKKVDGDFQYLNLNQKITREDIKELGLWKDIKNNVAQKVSGTIYASTDNILITFFLGIGMVGLVGNYTLIYNYVNTFMTKLMSPFQMSIGDYVHSNDKSNGLKMFRMFDFLSFCIACVVTSCYLVLFNPFIAVIFGKEYVLSIWYVVFFVANQYVLWNHQFLSQFRYAFGRYELDKWPIFIAAVVNIVASIVLCRYMGIAGIMLGTVLGHLGFWFGRVKVLYTEYLDEPVLSYILRQLIRLLIWGSLMGLVYYLGTLFDITILGIVIRAFVAVLVPVVVVFVLFLQTSEMKTVMEYVKTTFATIRNK